MSEQSPLLESLVQATEETLEQARRQRGSHPTGWEPGVEDRGDGTATAVSQPTESQNVDERALIEGWQLDPDEWRIAGTVNCRRWMTYDERWLYYYKADLVRKTGPGIIDYDELVKMIKKHKPHKAQPTGDEAFVVCIADPQIGKADGDGVEGTVLRMINVIDQVEQRIKELRKIGRPLGRLYVFGMGDIIEGCDGHYCVDAATPILTDDMRWVPAGSLKEGDGLYAFNEEGQGPRGRRYEKATVLSNKVEWMDAVRVDFSDGSSLVCTPEHPLLTCGDKGKQKKSKFVSAQDLPVGMRVAKLATPWGEGQSRDHGWLAGIMDGEGYLSGNKDRGGPNVLGVGQLPGPVNDRILKSLDQFGFKYTSNVNAGSGVVSTRIRGGYAEVLRFLGLMQSERLIAKVGEPHMQSEWVTVDSVTPIGEVPIARLASSSRTYFANGFASHNSQQTFTTQLNRRDQVKVARRLILKSIQRWAPMFDEVVVAAVGGNHGENRRDGKSFTDFADNDDVAIFEQIKEILDANPDAYGHVRFQIPDDELSLTLDVCGTITTITHGHLGRAGTTAAKKQIEWWKRQAHGMQPAGESTLLLTGHYHFLSVSQNNAKTHIQCPALEDRSDWWVNTNGEDSPAGLLTLVVGGGGWRDLQVLTGESPSL